MKIGFYIHGSVTTKEIAEAVSSFVESVAFRNAHYFNERETEKFESVVVDEGKNTVAIRQAYAAAGIKVSSVDEFLAGGTPQATPAPAKGHGPKEPFNPDAQRSPAKPGKKQGATPAPAKDE